jgi:very-short-patch-repair endonuclease
MRTEQQPGKTMSLLSGKFVAILLAVLVLVALAAALKAKSGKVKGSRTSPIKPKPVLTANEQPMYFRLVEALPDHVVLAQVAFSALLDTKMQATRNTFDRKVADFVICTKAFAAVAVIELDDASHRGREQEDSAREKLLSNAGYKVLRYKRVPNIENIRQELGLFDATAREKVKTAE